VAGLPLTASGRFLDGNIAAQDAVAWARLRDQGMVLVGHTHTHESAAGGTTDQVGNPWTLDRVAGGSSGGSAAALASRMVPAALGSDTCGSLRIPSACCGTSAIKPTHGRIPIEGIIPLAPSLDHPGPMARTVADCAALLAGLTAGEPATTPFMPPPAPVGRLPLSARSGSHPLDRLIIALTDRTAGLAVEADVAAGLDGARRACERLGARVIELPAPWTLDWDDLSRVLPHCALRHDRDAGRLVTGYLVHERLADRHPRARGATGAGSDRPSGARTPPAGLGPRRRVAS
jgi:aspartyl-tRNA(Asn)/glutamyl-tRNA(Gln) amidotransferase subunit A